MWSEVQQKIAVKMRNSKASYIISKKIGAEPLKKLTIQKLSLNKQRMAQA